MKVDLAALRALIEGEIEKLEQKTSNLQQQLQHIAAVEQIAKEAESSLHAVDRAGEAASEERELPEQSKRWFQQN